MGARTSFRTAGVSWLVTMLLLLPVVAAAQRTPHRLYVEVTNEAGVPFVDLKAEDFVLYENGNVRPVLRATLGPPMRVVLLVDSSGAVSGLLNNFRAGLTAFLDAFPGDHELALVTTGGQIGVRVPPTSDREKLRSAVASFAAQGGANMFLDSLLESDRRFLKSAPARWPVFVVLMTDGGRQDDPGIDRFNKFVPDFVERGGVAHAIVVSTTGGIATDLARSIVKNSAGVFESMTISNVLPDKMRSLAARLTADHKTMATRYELEYQGDAKIGQDITLNVARDGAFGVRLSLKRPF